MKARGFSLLEVMVAVAILAFIGSLTFGAFSSANALKQRVEQAEERDQTARGALSHMAREISMAFISDRFDRKRFRDRPTFFKLRDGRGDAALMFTSFAHERLHADAKESDQAVFEYKIDPDPDDGSKRDIFRRVKPILDEEPDRGGERAVLAEDVVAFSVQCWDPKAREWRDEWDSNSPKQTGGPPLPPRVKLTLTLKDENGKERTFSTQSNIFLDSVLGND